MKHLLHAPLLLVLFVVITTYGCKQKPGNDIQLNPFNDDYSDITSLSKRHLWGPANVHDPSIIKTDSFFYVYTTDAYYRKRGDNFRDTDEKIGNIPIRRSKDLVNWEFVGWVLDSIPPEAVNHVHSFTNNRGANNMWAPYVMKHHGIYRIYYSVSSFGTNSSYIGLAEAIHPEGPWTDKGCVVKTDPTSKMNAIDASVITDADNGRMWMHYGSYFGGLYCLELNPQTGMALTPGHQGHLTATRANREYKIIEAPEIMYHPVLKQYFLFVSYEPLFTYYNVRVGRSNKPEGPFYDFFGNNMADTTNNFPILTHSYMFNNHQGWSGNGHCAILNNDGRFYMLHQGRLAPDNLMMIMHVREMKWLPSGWPVVSPQRYAGHKNKHLKKKDFTGDWEIIVLKDLTEQSPLEQGQIPPGGWTYNKQAFNLSSELTLFKNGTTSLEEFKNWNFDGEYLKLGETICAVFNGWDWENQNPSIQFSGILSNGTSVWGKKLISKPL